MVWKQRNRHSLSAQAPYWRVLLPVIVAVLVISSSVVAVELGPGTLDLNLTAAALLDDNVNYASVNTEEAVETQITPGISYNLPIGSHTLSAGYEGTLVTSKEENASSFRQMPFAVLSLNFPGGLEFNIQDRFRLIQDRSKEEAEDVHGPDYNVNQAEVSGLYLRTGLLQINASYRNTMYRYESSAKARDSDTHEIGSSVAVPVSPQMAILATGQWASEELPDLPARNYRSYNVTGGLRFSGPARFDLDLTGGFQSFDYYDDPGEEPEESYSVQANLSAGISAALRLNLSVGTDVRSDAVMSGSIEFTPGTQTELHLSASRDAQRSFYIDYKYFINTALEIMAKQRIMRNVSLYGKTWYALVEYHRAPGVTSPIGQMSATREDTRTGWRAGIQYELGAWANFGVFGEYQQRESNLSLPFSDYKRTLIGATATLYSPR